MPPAPSTFRSKGWAKKITKGPASGVPIGRETDEFWHPAMSSHPPKNYTPGLIPILKAWLSSSHSRGETRKAVLCYDRTVYIQKQTWNETWGCGYLNFLMACAALMVQPFEPLYFPLIDEPIAPGVRNLQQWIEIAWDSGYDPEGKQQLKKLIGTQKWIGTADIWVALSARGIPSELVDFNMKKESGTNVEKLIEWTKRYFTPPPKDPATATEVPRSAFDALQTSPVISTDIMPFILQHSGHSRLIVGYEVTKSGATNLLAFDCGIKVSKPLRDYALHKFSTQTIPLQPREEGSQSPLKRRAGDSFSGPPTDTKRSRPVSAAAGDDSIEIVAEIGVKTPAPIEVEDSDDDIVITGFKSPSKTDPQASSTSKPPAKPVMPPPKDLQHFRITPKALEKHKQYQILYFPMTRPLTEEERRQRRHPMSTKIS